MKKTHLSHILRSALSLLLAVSLMMGTVPAVFAAAADDATRLEISGINKLDKNSLIVNYLDYLNGDVAFKLPEGIKEDDDVSVIVRVDRTSVMEAYDRTDKTLSLQEYATTDEAKEVIAAIDARKAELLALFDEQGVKYTLGEDYNTLFSGFEIKIKGGDYATTCKSLGAAETAVISQEYKSMATQLVENEVNVLESGIFNTTGINYDGTGMVVAVLDTGLDSNHTAFSPNNFTSTQLGLTYDQVASVIDKTTAFEWADGNLTVDNVFINNKVPFGYDYADNDPDVYSTHNNHGTHVSGVIVGKDDVITGVAPNAQLVSMKIFSDIQDTAMSSWILAALEDCVILGVDVINMSLGTACGFSHEGEEELLSGVYDRIREAGIAVVVAASNSYNSAYSSEANGNLPLTSNPDSGTVGSPGTYAGTLSIASVNGVETPYIKFGETIMYFDEANDNGGKEQKFFETLLGSETSKEMEYVTIPGVGRSADYTGLDVKGKIALVRRGQNTFEEKAMIAEAQGAAGIIIYNNVSGEIKMNIGDAKLAVCSISQDDGEVLAAQASGILHISVDQTSGPFMSDFSSWGPTPSLGIKPELTAHGGNILSSVTGGDYDRLSGTSMACPNTAGAVVLMRQYVVENFPAIADNTGAVTAMVNRLLMSTANILINTNGQPYAVRKQGAGLANLNAALGTPAIIVTYDSNGTAMDTTKLELGDDPDKTGVYEMSFAVDNFSKGDLSYVLTTKVLTEGVSDTKTSAGKTTVTEEAYVLEGATLEILSVDGGSAEGNTISVAAGKQAKVSVRITLTDENKKYLNKSFENGMYVEGFLSLDASAGTDIDLNVPYLAYYGDWTQAPMFDLEYYDTNADELDTGIDAEDKLMADAFATRAVGGLTGDYVSYLGSYYFTQDPRDIVIPANRDYISLSNQDGSIHALRFVWAGMLRGAKQIDIQVVDNATGEVVYEITDYDIRKSYGDGGPIRPSNIDVEFDTQDFNLPNNGEYTVRLDGLMDYGDGGKDTNKRNVFEFPLTTDYEAPTVTGVEYYYEYDKTAKKNRLYAKLSVYDNHYAMSGQLGYVTMGEDENGNATPEMKSFEQYMTPIYSKRNDTTVVTVELTDYLYQIKSGAMNKNSFVFTTYDYALNYATYEIRLPDQYIDFGMQEDIVDQTVVLSPNETFTLAPIVYPATQWGELLEFTSQKPGVANVVDDKIVAVAPGTTIIKIKDPNSEKNLTFTVKVLSEEDEGYRRYDKPVANTFNLYGYYTNKAYYMLNNEDKDIGDTGNYRFFEGNYSLSMYPSEAVTLLYELSAFFPKNTQVVYETGNESIVKVNEAGMITAVGEGFSSVTIKVQLDGKNTFYSQSVSIEVKDPFDAANGILNHYYGNGGLVEVPKRLSLKEIGSFAFSNFDYVEKTPEELEIDDRETSKQWYIGDGTITKVVLPEGVEKINAYAFANLTALEEIVLPSTLTAIEYGAFYNCTSLKKITFSGENNVIIVNQHAFEGCDLEGTVDMSAVCVISDYAFAGNKDLEGITTGDALLSIGKYAFAGCESLKDVTITAGLVKYGEFAFTKCESLESFYVNALVLPKAMFYECESLKSVTIGPDVNAIGEHAFLKTAVSELEVKEGNKAYQIGKKEYILSADGKKLMVAAPSIGGEFDASDIGGATVTTIGMGAFSHNEKITSVNLPTVTVVEAQAFASAKAIEEVKLGKVTSIGEYAFFETAISVLPAFTKDTKIGRYAFAFTDITSVTIPDGMEVAEGVFGECEQLTTVTVGNNVVLGKYAFGMNKDSIFKVSHYDKDGERYFYYTFSSALETVTIGDNVTIGETAFTNAASLKKVTLGKGAKLGKMAFYNNASLEEIDLSQVVEIGDYALSGDVYYTCLDESMSVAAIDSEGRYMYTYHAPRIPSATLTAATVIGEYAFAYCRDMVSVVLPDAITEIAPYTFAGCTGLQTINLSKIQTVGEYAFTECGALLKADLSSATYIDKYAFVYNKSLEKVIFNKDPLKQAADEQPSDEEAKPQKVTRHAADKEDKEPVREEHSGLYIGEGAFSYCENLTSTSNMGKVTDIGNYAFAYAALTSADLTDAVKVGDHAFMKEEYTPFKVTFGTAVTTFGDNPFALCVLAPLHQVEVTEFNGKKYEEKNYTYTINDNVTVHEGGLYVRVPNGWELVAYTGNSTTPTVMEDTVRVGAMAFAGDDLQMVTLPYTVAAVGHKAFYDCDKLSTVVFGSYEAPILEESFDPTYYESYTHIPGSGDYGNYTDYDGNEVPIVGEGIVPFFMWNATGGMYSNVFYGANFADYVGYVENKLTMVRPTNGQGYENYIYNHYFDLRVMGAAAADDVTVDAINAIKRIPERVTLNDRDLVEAARAAYNKIATIEQQALVTNYDTLVSAEQRLQALSAEEGDGSAEGGDNADTCNKKKGVPGWLWIVILFLVNDAIILWAIWAYKKGYFTKEYLTAFFKALPGRVATFFKKLPGRFVHFCKAIPGFMKKLPGRLWRGLKATGRFIARIAKKVWAWLTALGLLIAGLCKKCKKCKKTDDAEEAPVEEISTEDAPAVEDSAEEVIEEVVEEVTEETDEDIVETPVEETVEEAPAKASRAKEKKARKSLNPQMIKMIAWIAAGAVALGGVVWMAVAAGKDGNTPYHEYDKKGYTVAIKFDANGGQFGDNPNTTALVDTFNPVELAGEDGVARIALVEPNAAVRGNGNSFEAIMANHVLAGWYTKREQTGTDENGNPLYSYSGKWNFATDRVPVPADGFYTATDPVLTLYAVWVPLFKVEFYDRANPDAEPVVKEFNPEVGIDLTVPHWDESTGTMKMYQFPTVSGKTFDKVYYDAAGQKAVEGAAVHPGKVNAVTGQAEDAVLKLYVDYVEGEWYHIYNAQQLVDNVNLEGHYVLHGDLDFADLAWPVGFSRGTFNGSIEGNGHTIKNVTLEHNSMSGKPISGLFGSIGADASLTNLTLDRITMAIRSGTRTMDAGFGLLAGSLSGDATLTELKITGSKLQIDSAAAQSLSMTKNYAIGLVCGVGDASAVTADIVCEAVGDAPETVKITVEGNEVTVEFTA